MILTVAIVLYAIGTLVSARLIGGHLAWKWKSKFVERPEALDWLGGAFFGLGAGLVWPVLLVLRTAHRVALPAIGAEREAREKERVDELERRRRENAQHVAELEANLDADIPSEDV